MGPFHFCLSAARNLSSFQLLPTSLITDLLQLFFGLPLFLFPWGFQSRAAFGTSPSSILNVWPIHLNFLFLISKFISSCPFTFHRCLHLVIAFKFIVATICFIAETVGNRVATNSPDIGLIAIIEFCNYEIIDTSCKRIFWPTLLLVIHAVKFNSGILQMNIFEQTCFRRVLNCVFMISFSSCPAFFSCFSFAFPSSSLLPFIRVPLFLLYFLLPLLFSISTCCLLH